MAGPPPPPPVHHTPEYIAETNMPWIIAVVTTVHILAMIVVALRIYTRVVLLRAPGWDDWTMLASALCAFGGGWIIFLYQIPYGIGRHQDIIPPNDFIELNHAGFFQTLVSTDLSIMFLKISIALNLLRLSTNKIYTWILWFTIGITALYETLGSVAIVVRCNPVPGYWDTTIGASCYSIQLFVALALVNTSFNIFTDVILATVPVPIIWNLQMKRRLRLYVIGILSLGYFAVAMGIVKAFYQIAYGSQKDKTFLMGVQFWGFLQINLGIMAACAPTLKPLVGKVLGLTSSYSTDRRYYQYGGSRDAYANGSRAPPTGSRRHTTSRPKDDLELHSRNLSADGVDMLPGGLNTAAKGENISIATSTFYTHGDNSESGSEEKILRSPSNAHLGPRGHGGIMRTTEVIVQR